MIALPGMSLNRRYPSCLQTGPSLKPVIDATSSTSAPVGTMASTSGDRRTILPEAGEVPLARAAHKQRPKNAFGIVLISAFQIQFIVDCIHRGVNISEVALCM